MSRSTTAAATRPRPSPGTRRTVLSAVTSFCAIAVPVLSLSRQIVPQAPLTPTIPCPPTEWPTTKSRPVYPLGSSQITGSVSAFANQNYNFPIAIVNGPANRLYLVVSAMPAGVTNFLVTRTVYDPSSMLDAFYPIDSSAGSNHQLRFTSDHQWSLFIPITSFSNGIALFPTNQVPLYCACDLSVQAVGEDGKCGPRFPAGGRAFPDVSHIWHRSIRGRNRPNEEQPLLPYAVRQRSIRLLGIHD